MRHPFILLIAVFILVAAEVAVTVSMNSFGDDLRGIVESTNVIVKSPRREEAISSPVVITGQARGTWFFEATFPVVVVNWDGLIIGEGYAEAKGDWMTENFVPFEAVVKFARPDNIQIGTYNERGAIILKKENPSGLPAYDEAVEIPIRFN